MTLLKAKPFSLSCLLLIACAFAHAQQCPVNSIVIKGHLEHPPRQPSVRVQLFYPTDPRKNGKLGTVSNDAGQPGESTEAILDGNSFTIPVEFVTSDRRTEMNFNPRCNHKPQSVVVTLKTDSGTNDDDQLDRVTLDFPRDFQSDDSRHYTLRSELVLNGQP